MSKEALKRAFLTGVAVGGMTPKANPAYYNDEFDAWFAAEVAKMAEPEPATIPTRWLEPISRDPKTQNQVAGVLLLREAKKLEDKIRAQECKHPDWDENSLGDMVCSHCGCIDKASEPGD